MRVLFICGKARARSPTAAQVFADRPGISTDFGGLSNDADDALSSDQIDWADLVLCMERRHATRLNEKFRGFVRGKKIVVLDIRDRYSFMDDALIEELHLKAAHHLR